MFEFTADAEEQIQVIFTPNVEYHVLDKPYTGLQIVTTARVIYMLVASERQCCEEIGYIVSEDDLKRFSGSRLLRISATRIVNDGQWETKPVMERVPVGTDECVTHVAFIHIETTEGPLDVAVYNHHNGYYGHEVLFRFLPDMGSAWEERHSMRI